MEENKKTLSRRDFLRGAALTASAMAAGACAAPTPEVIKEIVKEEVVVTQVVEVNDVSPWYNALQGIWASSIVRPTESREKGPVRCASL